MGGDIARWKQEAASEAIRFVSSGMAVGLGHGSTAIFAVRLLADMISSGRIENIIGIPCSLQVEEEARRYGVPLARLEEHPVLDLTIDGADEVDPDLNLIKGGGGALLREKIVAQATRREIIVVDETKLSPALGTKRAVPVEVTTFGWNLQTGFLESLGARVSVRRNSNRSLFETDQGNYILDCRFGPITNPRALDEKLKRRAGVVEHGLFLGLATDVIVAGKGGVRHLTASSKTGLAYADPD